MTDKAPFPTVSFDRAKRERFRKAYNQAVADKSELFTFEGGEWLTAYAKYVLEFLDQGNDTVAAY